MNEDEDMEFNFDDLDKEIDAQKIILEKMAELMAPLFKAFKANGLTGQEAAALTAAYFSQSMPVEAQGPREGS